MASNQKVAGDIIIAILAILILSTTILSVSTNNWNITYENSTVNRTGLFQKCSYRFCCDTKELDRSVTILALFSVIFISTATLSSLFLMAIAIDDRTQCYILVPLTCFGAGISMTLTLIQVLDRININGYSGFMFIIDTILAYVLGAVSLLHANMFYL